MQPADHAALPSGFYNAKQVAERLGVSVWVISRLAKLGICPVTPIYIGRQPQWRIADVEAFVTGP